MNKKPHFRDLSELVNGDPGGDTICGNCGLPATKPSDMCMVCGAYAAKKLTAKIMGEDIGDWI